MYKLDVSKSPPVGFEVCLYREGQPVEDFLFIDADDAGYLVRTGDKIVKGNESDEATDGSVSLDKSPKHGNAYQLTVRVNDNYVKVFVLTEVELKLFIASLKRAIDG